MDAIVSNNPMSTIFEYFNVSSINQSSQSSFVETCISSSDNSSAKESICSVSGDIQLYNFQTKLAQFRQSISALTEGGAQISGTTSRAGLSDVNIVLKSGENIYFDDLSGNIRFTDTDDGGIEVISDEFIKIYDQHGQLVSETSGGSPLEGTDKGDVIFNFNGEQVNGNGGNDTVFTMPGSVNINCGTGDDKVFVFDSPVSGSTLNISLGAGNDSFQFLGSNNMSTSHTLYIDGGDGDDIININRGVIGGRIDAGNGNDSIASSELLINVAVIGGDGNDRITLKGLANGFVDVGAGTNFASIETLFSSKLIHNNLSSINIMKEYKDDFYCFTKNNDGSFIPSDAIIDGKKQLSIKV